MIEALKAAVTEWTFELMNFVAGRRGAVVAGQTISTTSSKGLVYKQERGTRCWRCMCNAYAKHMKQ